MLPEGDAADSEHLNAICSSWFLTRRRVTEPRSCQDGVTSFERDVEFIKMQQWRKRRKRRQCEFAVSHARLGNKSRETAIGSNSSF